MNQDIIHVYFMPGMAASSKIFEYIELPKNQFETHFLDWVLPIDNETIEAYAKRMVKNIKNENSVLIGVSFGGVLVQEMSKHIRLRKLIIISSVKSVKELPKKMHLAKVTMAYKLLPVQWVANIDSLAKYIFGENIPKRISLYKKYLSVNDSKYLSWAIENMVCWNQETYIKNIIHIHGDKDTVFRIKYIKDCIVIKDGTHIMIINRFKWFNKHLPKLIMS